MEKPIRVMKYNLTILQNYFKIALKYMPMPSKECLNRANTF